MLKRLKAYYQLTKPGIVRGNAIHVVAGALLASTVPLDWKTIFGVLLGTSFVIASACIINNYIDRDIDAKMKRTKRRPSVTGEISVRSASIFATVLVLIGFQILYLTTNAIVVAIGALAYLMYVVAYGWAKRNTVHSTLVGAVPGALPAMAGYVAVTGELSIGAWLVFLLILVWQMPHFYAISLFRKSEYAAANLPVLGVVKPLSTVKKYILAYIVIYAIVVLSMIALNVLQPVSGAILMIGAGYWLKVYATPNEEIKWAKSIFGASLLLTLLLLLASALNIFARTMV